jgi:hypothetical protein
MAKSKSSLLVVKNSFYHDCILKTLGHILISNELDVLVSRR